VSTVGKVVRALVGLAVIVVLVLLVNGWYQQYKSASLANRSGQTSETTTTAETTQVVAVSGGQRVVILVDGLALRATPTSTAAPIRSLKKGEQLLLVGTSGAWLQVRDSKNGRIGYVGNVPTDVQVVK